MATFYPSLNEILQDTMEKHIPGELVLLEELRVLPDSYNVYFQPHINCAHPDIVVESQDRGILIIEVKDWNLNSYSYHKPNDAKKDKYGHLTVSGSNTKLSTPFEQVQYYKDELFETLSPELCSARVMSRLHNTKKNGPHKRNIYGTVKTCVFFSDASSAEITNLFGNNKFTTWHNQLFYAKFTLCWSKEDKGSLGKKTMVALSKNDSYEGSIHEAIQALFVPSIEWLEQMTPIELTAEQKRFSECHPGKRTRILGTPGSGKTLVIAQKAINCYRTKHQPVLILTYNITLKNYIRDKIAVNSRDLSGRERAWAFEILHLDQFLPQMLRKYGLKGPSISDYTSRSGDIDWDGYRHAQMAILSNVKDLIEAYTTVLIDEAQDFSYDWFGFIDEVFVDKEADYLVVADEKQNIYGQSMDDLKLPRVSGFRGAWAKLKGSQRMTPGGYQLAISFQQQFMKDKYNLDEPIQLDLFSITEKRAYYQLKQFDPEAVFSLIESFRKDDKAISPNDICILTFSNYDVQKIDYCIRKKFGNRSTQSVCETAEVYKELRQKSGVDDHNITSFEKQRREAKLEKELNEIRHVKRNAFNMNPGTIKISTIHSFKGWEINTIILIINETTQKITPELVYTAITRTKSNLLIINCGDNQYHDFFKRELGTAVGVSSVTTIVEEQR